MRRIGGDRGARRLAQTRQARHEAAFGAVAVDHVGTRAGDKGAEFGEREKVGGTGIAGDAGLADAKRPAAGNARKGLIDAFGARVAVEEDPDFMTKRRLRRGEVDDMAKQAAERAPAAHG